MSALTKLISNTFFSAFDNFRVFSLRVPTSAESFGVGDNATHYVVTDLTISFSSPKDSPPICPLDTPKWHRIETDLYLHSLRRSAWLEVARIEEQELTVDDLVITDVRVSEQHPSSDQDSPWESRPGGIWLLRNKYTGDHHQVVTAIDVLFGVDAVDPRPQWALSEQPLLFETQPEVPVARLTVQHGRGQPLPGIDRPPLKVNENGKFKIVQISDTHMVTGVGVCNDAMDANGQPLPQSEADPLTINFVGSILDIEKPDLVILSGDQLHHDILDSKSTLFKTVAPFIERSIPFATVFGNHDDEGSYALSRAAQMSLLQSLPFSLSQAGPKEVDGIGNYYLQVFDHATSKLPLLTFFLIDSHGQLSRKLPWLGYEWIKQSQIDWFRDTSQALRKQREERGRHVPFHLSLSFQHIPFPEYGDSDLIIRAGHRGEPTEGPKFNSSFYEALVKEDIMAVGSGHDHVNDFCGLKPQQDGTQTKQFGPWLCYSGSSGFGAYGQYGEKKYYRRARIWDLDTSSGTITTWKRVEYATERVDELRLVNAGVVLDPRSDSDTDK